MQQSFHLKFKKNAVLLKIGPSLLSQHKNNIAE